jgi:hypothetical protein
MIVYTGKDEDLALIDKYEIKHNRIDVVIDGAGVKHIPREVIDFPLFAEKKEIFERLQPIEYTPHVEQ